MKNDPTPYSKRSPLEHERDMEDGFTTVEFLASSCRDIETGEPLEQTARPDLYVHDVQIVIDDWRAMEAEIERLRAVLLEIADGAFNDNGDVTMNHGHMIRAFFKARATLNEMEKPDD